MQKLSTSGIILLLPVIYGYEIFTEPKAVGSERFPYVAYTFTPDWRGCAGIIISEYHVLTAANCVIRAPVQIYVGTSFFSISKSYTLPSSQLYSAVSTRVHEHFDEDTFANNIALLKVGRPFIFSKTVKPATIGPVRFSSNKEYNSKIVGWGYKIEEIQLKYTTGKILKQETCKRCFGDQFSETTQFCFQSTGKTLLNLVGDPIEIGNFVIGYVLPGEEINKKCPEVHTVLDLSVYFDWISKHAGFEIIDEPLRHILTMMASEDATPMVTENKSEEDNIQYDSKSPNEGGIQQYQQNITSKVEDLDIIKNRLDSLYKQTNNINNKVNILENDLQSYTVLKNRINVLINDRNMFKENMARFKKSLNNLEDKCENQSKSLNNLLQDISNKLEVITKRVNTLDKNNEKCSCSDDFVDKIVNEVIEKLSNYVEPK